MGIEPRLKKEEDINYFIHFMCAPNHTMRSLFIQMFRFSQFLNSTWELHFLELQSHPANTQTGHLLVYKLIYLFLTILPSLNLALSSRQFNKKQQTQVSLLMDGLNLNKLNPPNNVSSESHLTTKCILDASLLMWTIRFLPKMNIATIHELTEYHCNNKGKYPK